MRLEHFITCSPGVEPILHAEVKALRLSNVEQQVGGVRFIGSMHDAWRANLELRTAIRVLQRLDRFAAPDA
ncbi:MAG: class I SAM-dependent RNA methyltransferase, partial [Planctomycetes bacterium]|nr:class I SAM-dependent RNA methyltransferase [Planctomycetota bacterium]